MRMESSLRRVQVGLESRVITPSEALAKVLEQAEPVESIEVSLTESIGLVLAEPAFGDVDLPPFDGAKGVDDELGVGAAAEGAGIRLQILHRFLAGQRPRCPQACRSEPVIVGLPLPETAVRSQRRARRFQHAVEAAW